MSGLTARLGEFLADISFSRIPSDAIPLVRDAFTDTVAVTMAGVAEPVTDITRRAAMADGREGESRVCLSTLRASATASALISGTAAHALDFDDQSLSGHPSAVLVPAILAEGEALDSSGEELVAAYVAGYEVWAELVARNSGYHSKGWHPTSVFGVLGAAAAVAVLQHLPAEKAATSLAIAGSLAAGLAVNFGTMTKPLHAGVAAQNGVLAARLAGRGLTAAADALENPKGFLHAFSPKSEPDRALPKDLGQNWHLLWQRLCVKKYPTCYFMHRSFDATVRMLAGRNIGAQDIAGIDVTMGKGQTAVLVNERPRDGLEAKFSEQFAMAAAVVIGRMGIAEVSDAVVRRPDIQNFFPKVKLHAVDEYDPRDPVHSPTERVVVRLNNGGTIDSGPIASIKGHATDPLTTEELWAKFSECTAATHNDGERKRLFDLLQSVEKLKSPRSLPTCGNIFQ
ncbi:MAG TPA: MmgE/PrpD family protein [Bauldia sp.]|nr:MmgE/PrpD family protein [Bauldia sp.]